MRLWEAATGKEIRTLKVYENLEDHEPEVREVRSVTFAPDGKTVAAGCGGGVRLYEVATGKEIHTLKGHQVGGDSVAFSSDGKTVAAGGGVVCLWETATGKEIHTRPGHKGDIRSVSFAPDDKTVATGGEDGTVRLWEAATGKEIHTWRLGHKGWVCAVAFSPDGKMMVMGEICDGTLHLREVASGKKIHTWRPPNSANRGVRSVAFSPDGKTVATGEIDGQGTVRLWEAATGKLIRTWEIRTGSPGDEREAHSVAFSPDGKIVVTGGGTGVVRLWEVATGKEICILRVSEEAGTMTITGMALSPDGRTLAAASDNSVRLWDLPSGTALTTLAGHQSQVLGLAFSSDGRTLASVSEDTTGLVWDLTNRAARPAIKLGPDVLQALWDDLASKDAARAGRAVWNLAATPAQSVPLLRDRLRPVPADTGKQLARLIADLDAEEFKVRESARRGLEELGPDAEPALRKGLEGSPSVEVRKRLEQLLEVVKDQKKRGGFWGECLCGLRAVAVLERVGTPEAREVLKTLATGAAGFRLTQEAQSALRRLDKARRP